MFRSLARNIAISGIAYFFISIIGLLLAPVLIGAYGLAGYGQILLARIFLPSAAFGFLDLGVGENTTRIVASARVNGEMTRAGQSLAFLAVLAVMVAVAIGLLLAILAPQIAGWLSIPGDQRPGFIVILRITAALEPILFGALVAEGVLKGSERFRRLRTCELVSSSFFAVLTLGAVNQDMGPNVVAGAMLAGQTLRALLALGWARKLMRDLDLRLLWWNRAQRSELLGWSATMFHNKALGTLQTQIGSPLLGILVGPAAVGLYDAIIRLPRFVKTLFGLLSSTVLPLAARLRAGDENDNTTKLARVGIVGGFVFCAPLAAMSAAYSEPILTYWLGREVAQHWPWMALMMVVPLANMPKSFGGSMIMTDRDAMRIMNRLFILQVALQLTIAVALLDRLDLWSFVVAEVATVVVMLPVQLHLIARRLGLGNSYVFPMAVMLAVAVCVAIIARTVLPFPGPIALVGALVAGAAVVWAIAPFAVLDAASRRRMRPLVATAISQSWPLRLRR